MNHVAKWLVMLALGFPATLPGAAQYVEIALDIEFANYPSGSTNDPAGASTGTVSVVCVTGTNEWRIDGAVARGGDRKWHFDGTNVYHTLSAIQPLPAESKALIERVGKLRVVPFERARSNLTINIWASRDGHPMGDSAVNLTWLAFCSGNYLKQDGRLIPLPCDILHHTPDRFGYSDQTMVFAAGFGLPRSVDLFSSRSLFKTSVDDFYREGFRGDRYTEWTMNTAATLPEGDLTFHYEATQTTNFLGWTLPLRFEFFQKPRTHIQNARSFWRGIGLVKSIRETTKPTGLFDLTMQQTVVDHRFRDEASQVNGLIYATGDTFLSPTNDPNLQNLFRDRIERSSRRTKSRR